MTISNLRVIGTISLMSVAACGNSGDNAPTNNDQEKPDRVAISADHRSLTVRTSNEIAFQAEGDTLARLSGGCDGSSTMSIGFQSGEIYQPSWRYFAFDTAEDVVPRQLGEVALSRVVFDNGVKEKDQSGIYPPNRLEGTGTLTITKHEAGTHKKRLEGAVRATVSGPDGNPVPIEALFSIPLACWSVGID